MDASRKHDIAEINKSIKSRDPLVRKSAQEAGDKIRKEQSDGWMKEARTRLVEERMKGNNGNVRDISESIYKHTKHKEVIGATTFGFHMDPKRWEEIFGKK